MIKALFLDRDGTINIDYGYVHKIQDFKFIDGIFDLCETAIRRNYKIFVITNQSGIERGYFTDADFRVLTKYMCNQFAARNIPITEVFYCPTLTGPNRKPNPGMFLAAQKKHNIDMARSVSIGDSQRDIDAAAAAGVLRNFLFQGNYQKIKEKL